MCSTFGGVDGVREGVDRLSERRIPLQRDLGTQAGIIILRADFDDRRVGDAFAGVDVSDEVDDAALVVIANALDLLL